MTGVCFIVPAISPVCDPAFRKPPHTRPHIIQVQGGDGALLDGDFAIVEADGLLGLSTGNADTRGNCTNMRLGVL
jgi:hypothetical protein